jgi:Arc/MetJ family transcription regulator
MATNLSINEKLLSEAQKIGMHKTKKATVNEALKEYIQRRKQSEMTKIFGTIDYENNYDYKKLRSR